MPGMLTARLLVTCLCMGGVLLCGWPMPLWTLTFISAPNELPQLEQYAAPSGFSTLHDLHFIFSPP
jgi:hypothetical protein